MSNKKIFSEDLNFGNKGEELFYNSDIVQKIFPNRKLFKIEDLEEQKTKGDFKAIDINYEHVEDIFFEIKTREPKCSKWHFKDILIELFHEQDNGDKSPGWIEKYDKNTYLVYQWTQDKNEEVILIRPVIIFKPSDLKEHKKWLDSFPKTRSKNKTYTTINATIPLDKFQEKIKVWLI